MTNKKYQIIVKAESTYIFEESNADNNHYSFSYKISISNLGTMSAKLLKRHWIIKDSDNKTREVKGSGVLGQQPFINPNETIEYTSGAIINSPVGTMKGSYLMEAEDGYKFEAKIHEFILSVPRTLH